MPGHVKRCAVGVDLEVHDYSQHFEKGSRGEVGVRPQGPGAPLAAAAWSADSKSVVVAGKGATQLAALYLTRPPPSLKAQIFPLPLPPLPGAPAGHASCRLSW